MRGERLSTSARMLADNKPECSATPTPNMATSTVPKGAKPVKLVTILVTRRRSPSALSSEFTAIHSPSFAGRGSATDTPRAAAIPLASTTSTHRMANSVTGCGNRFPSHSTLSRKRVNAPRFRFSSRFCGFVIRFISLIGYFSAKMPM